MSAPAYTHIDKKFSVNQYFLHVIINGVSYKSAITTYGLACAIIVYPFPLGHLSTTTHHGCVDAMLVTYWHCSIRT